MQWIWQTDLVHGTILNLNIYVTVWWTIRIEGVLFRFQKYFQLLDKSRQHRQTFTKIVPSTFPLLSLFKSVYDQTYHSCWWYSPRLLFEVFNKSSDCLLCILNFWRKLKLLMIAITAFMILCTVLVTINSRTNKCWIEIRLWYYKNVSFSWPYLMITHILFCCTVVMTT